jgi:hypothetical protein
MKNICLLYALYAGIVIQVAAGNPPSSGIIVRGTVTDTVGAVIWHASLRITAIPDTKHPQAIEESGKARAVVTAETDQNGRFSVELQPGDYQICVSREAFSTACREIETAARQEINLNFPLTLDPAYQQAHAPAASEVMDQRLQSRKGKYQLEKRNRLRSASLYAEQTILREIRCSRYRCGNSWRPGKQRIPQRLRSNL